MRQVLFLCLAIGYSASVVAGKPSFQFTGLDAIYGVDDREQITSNTAEKYKEAARSVALIVSDDLLKKGFSKTLISGQKAEKNFNMCSGERFNDEMTLPGCSGFLVGEDLLVSAGHCFESAEDCENKKIIFDVDAKKQTSSGYIVSTKNVFACKEIISSASGINAVDGQDYALIRLKKAVKMRPFLKVRAAGKIEDEAAVFMIGHPLGMPLTLSKAAKIANNEQEVTFKVGIDAFEGNSGSPVINDKTMEVEGILINGQQDIVSDSQNQCYRNAKHESGGEGVYRITGLSEFLKK